MPNISAAFNTAKWALLTNQLGMQVVGNNIANVNNPSYTRQVVELQAAPPTNDKPGMIGAGVRVLGIKRNYDEFMVKQLHEATSLQDYWTSYSSKLDRVDITFNDSIDKGLNKAISEFFVSWDRLADNPAGLTERRDLIGKAQNMSQIFTDMDQSMRQLQTDIDSEIGTIVTRVNTILDGVVNLNKQIHEYEIHGTKANDLRDQREALLRELSGVMQISFYEQDNNEVVVSLAQSGNVLVAGETNYKLSATHSATSPLRSVVSWNDLGGNSYNITNTIRTGKLGALLDLRDNVLEKFTHNLNQLAGSIVREVNTIHSGGHGLDGTTGFNFFDNMKPRVDYSLTNTGTGLFTNASVINSTAVPIDGYRLEFTSPTTYNVFNIDTNLSSGTYTFTSGGSIPFFTQRGLDIVIAGAINAGDSFTIMPMGNTSPSMKVSNLINSDPRKVQASLTGAQTDGGNARALGALRLARVMASGSFTFQDFYGSVVGDVGVRAKQARDSMILQDATATQIDNKNQQISGVSLDEEMIDLLKYQRAYTAATKLVNTVDEMLQALISVK